MRNVLGLLNAMFRCCVRWRGYRTAAAFSRARLLYSGCVQDEMLRHVSSDAAVCFTVTPELRVGDGSLLPPQKAGAEELQGDGQAACRLESRGQPTQMSNRSSGNSIWGGNNCKSNFCAICLSKYEIFGFSISRGQKVIAEPFCCSMDLI